MSNERERVSFNVSVFINLLLQIASLFQTKTCYEKSY